MCSGAAMIIGFIVGGWMNFFGNTDSEEFLFKPEVFFFVLLPPIIFDAGYTMNKSR